eukprot:1739977-Amphidinium_carterae.1
MCDAQAQSTSLFWTAQRTFDYSMLLPCRRATCHWKPESDERGRLPICSAEVPTTVHGRLQDQAFEFRVFRPDDAQPKGYPCYVLA